MLSEALGDRGGAGLKIATWVVDDPAELRALARFDLYGVGTNRPGRCSRLSGLEAEACVGKDENRATTSRIGGG